MNFDKAQLQYFTKKLMEWHRVDNDRSLPWKEEQDPYKIWLSEIILQQTRAEQGLPYYQNFISAYPTVTDLANATDEDVFRMWQGLGYYNRCKNMLYSARYIRDDLNGVFPATYEGILALKGVGVYTAAAIASFAYGLPRAVVDGNVYRVLSRYFGIETPIDSTSGKKEFATLADKLLDKTDSAAYNQAIMDMGATVCKPAAPDCTRCSLQKNCFAYDRGVVADLPVKAKKLKVKERHFHYILFYNKGKVWIEKRTENDIWQNLHQPFLIEHDKKLTKAQLQDVEPLNRLPKEVSSLLEYEGELSQRLTHRVIKTYYYTCYVEQEQVPFLKGGKWVANNELKRVAFPKSIVSFFEKKSYF